MSGKALRGNVATCLARSIPAPGHLLLSTARDEILGQAGFWPAPLATLINVFSVSFSVSRPSSWCLQRVPIQMLAQSVLITRQSCHPPWNAQEELETPGPPLSSKLRGHLFWFPRDTWWVCCNPDQYPRPGWDTLTQSVRDDSQQEGRRVGLGTDLKWSCVTQQTRAC